MKFSHRTLVTLYNNDKSKRLTVVDKERQHNADFPMPASKAWGWMVITDGVAYYKVHFEEEVQHWIHNPKQKLIFTGITQVKKTKKVIEYDEWESL